MQRGAVFLKRIKLLALLLKLFSIISDLIFDGLVFSYSLVEVSNMIGQVFIQLYVLAVLGIYGILLAYFEFNVVWNCRKRLSRAC